MAQSLTLFSVAAASMAAQILLIIVGIIVVLKAADLLTKGAVALASRMGVPEIVIGLTVVSIGTSMPEFFVSMVSAINGTPDLAVGNVVGSNIFNAMLIVGVAATIAPIAILPSTIKRDIPVAVFASILLMAMTLDGKISRIDSAVLFVLFIAYMWVTVRGAKSNGQTAESTSSTPMKAWKACGLLIIGLVGLILGSEVFVANASALAQSFGISDAVIGLTIVAGGTSLPELATSVVAARKGESGIAIGNVLGSNVFNILMILGLTGLISPMAIQGITPVDLAVMVVSMLLLWLFCFTKHRIERWEGVTLTVLFLCYMAWLVTQA